MSNFPIVDLIVGMIFIYFLLSIICSSIVEVVLTGGKYRAAMLAKWLTTIFDKEIETVGGKKVMLGQAIMDHCSITALSPEGKATAYIDAKNFTEALLEKITYDPKNPKSIIHDIDGIIASLEKTEGLPHDLQRVLLNYAAEAKDVYKAVSVKTASEMELFQGKIAHWYDSNMERVSGALKTQYVRKFTFWTALGIAVLTNADTIRISQFLYSNPTARAKVAAQAYSSVQDTALIKSVDRLRKSHAVADSVSQNMKQITDTLNAHVNTLKVASAALDDVIPLGWNSRVFNNSQGEFSGWLIPSKLIGLAVTILAMMMGAPFWFDLLNKIANLRGNGKRPEKADEKTAV